jgi:transcriptional regulator with AAA-type ATPase domain
MPRQRTAAQQLVRQFAAAARPIYLVDDRRVIVYCNPACAAWAGVSEENLIGQTCVYGSPPPDQPADLLAAAAARLCPSPNALAGMSGRGTVSVIDVAGRLVFRQAEFWPLSMETLADGSQATSNSSVPDEAAIFATDPPAGVLVLVESIDLSEPPVEATAGDSIFGASGFGSGATGDATSDQLHAELARWRHRFAGRFGLERMVGTSATATRVRAQVALAAAAPASVLVVGPVGSGKEHVAKAIHYRQPPESIGSLVPIDCAALDAEQVISTLQALARWPADASARRRTLLMTSLDALPLEAQAIVLQLLGSLASWRLTATVSAPPARLMAAEKLRADLAAALSTLTIELVPLCERIDDLPLLAQSFLEVVNATAARQVAGFTPEALDQLMAYPWPGNLDELAEFVRQSHERATEAEISPRDLPSQIHLAADATERSPRRSEPIDLEGLLAKIETELIERALAQAKGNKTRAAHLLGLTRPRLYRRLVQLGLEDESPEP